MNIVVVLLQVTFFLVMGCLGIVSIVTIAYLLELHSAARFWPRRQEWLTLCILVQVIYGAGVAYTIFSGFWELLR